MGLDCICLLYRHISVGIQYPGRTAISPRVRVKPGPSRLGHCDRYSNRSEADVDRSSSQRGRR